MVRRSADESKSDGLTMEAVIINEWVSKINDCGCFKDSDPKTWIVTLNNVLEIIDYLNELNKVNINDLIPQSQLNALVGTKIKFTHFIKKLFVKLVKEHGLKLHQLIDQDRI